MRKQRVSSKFSCQPFKFDYDSHKQYLWKITKVHSGEIWLAGSILHRRPEHGPALVARCGIFDEDELACYQTETQYVYMGLPHNPNDWAMELRMDDVDVNPIYCDTYTRKWMINGVEHREDGPSTERGDDLNKYKVNGKYHSMNDIPSREIVEKVINSFTHYEDGMELRIETVLNETVWSCDGEYHRDGDTPARKRHINIYVVDIDGNIVTNTVSLEELIWYQHGAIDRKHGPARIRQYADGRVLQSFYRAGIFLGESTYQFDTTGIWN